MEINKPIKKFRSGNIESAIWMNEKVGKDGSKINFKTVSVKRSWNQDGKWHDATINLRRNDIPKIMLVLQKAQEEIFLNSNFEDGEEE